MTTEAAPVAQSEWIVGTWNQHFLRIGTMHIVLEGTADVKGFPFSLANAAGPGPRWHAKCQTLDEAKTIAIRTVRAALTKSLAMLPE